MRIKIATKPATIYFAGTRFIEEDPPDRSQIEIACVNRPRRFGTLAFGLLLPGQRSLVGCEIKGLTTPIWNVAPCPAEAEAGFCSLQILPYCPSQPLAFPFSPKVALILAAPLDSLICAIPIACRVLCLSAFSVFVTMDAYPEYPLRGQNHVQKCKK